MQNLGDLGANGAGVKIPSRKCHIWNRRPWFAYTLCNFYGATMMIKGSLLLSIPIVNRIRLKKTGPFWAKLWWFWRINRGLTLNLSCITPKRHTIAWFHVFWAIARKNPSTGLTVHETQKKGINKKGTKTLYFTRLPISPQWMDLYQIWFKGPLLDVINCTEFCSNRLRGPIL